MMNEKSIYEIEMIDINGKKISLSEYKGKIIMIVNVASKCGFTYQYSALQAIYEKYKDKGFVTLGFPSNDFLRQEPGSNEEILQFCSVNYNVTFPMFSKIKVKGKEKAVLYKYLTDKETNPEFEGEIKWNFTKFLINKQGEIINRFEPKTEPDSEEVIVSIENSLK